MRVYRALGTLASPRPHRLRIEHSLWRGLSAPPSFSCLLAFPSSFSPSADSPPLLHASRSIGTINTISGRTGTHSSRAASPQHRQPKSTLKRNKPSRPRGTSVRASAPNSTMSAPSSQKFYAVAIGRERGIYSTWAQCEAQVKGFTGARFKKFPLLEEARDFLAAHPAPSSPSTPVTTVESGLSSSTASEAQANRRQVSTRTAAAGAGRKRPLAEREEDEVVDVDADSDSSVEIVVSDAPKRRGAPLRRCEATVGAVTSSTAIAPSQAPPPPSPLPSALQEVYVDGACSNNGRGAARSQAGYGGFYGPGDPRNFSLPLSPSETHTNNRAELHAVIHALKQAFKDVGLHHRTAGDPSSSPSPAGRQLGRLLVHTDSKYVLDGLTKYSRKWIGNGFTLSCGVKPVQNQDLWKELIRLRDTYNMRYHAQTGAPPRAFNSISTRNDGSEGFELRHVRGHDDIHGNEMADQLAVQGAKKNWDPTTASPFK